MSCPLGLVRVSESARGRVWQRDKLAVAIGLSVLDGGKWACEAQQRVAAMDCRSAVVEDWLRQWGSSTPCSDAKR